MLFGENIWNFILKKFNKFNVFNISIDELNVCEMFYLSRFLLVLRVCDGRFSGVSYFWGNSCYYYGYYFKDDC